MGGGGVSGGVWPWAYGWCWVYMCDCNWIDEKSTIFAHVNKSPGRILQLEVCPDWQKSIYNNNIVVEYFT